MKTRQMEIGSQQQTDALIKYWGNKLSRIPQTAAEVRVIIDNVISDPALESPENHFPPIVYLALQNIICLEMGGKLSPKQRDRKHGIKKSQQRRTRLKKGRRNKSPERPTPNKLSRKRQLREKIKFSADLVRIHDLS